MSESTHYHPHVSWPLATKLRAIRIGLERRIASPPEFVVVGTGRCGTTYTARLLSQAGIPCGHERVYTPYGVINRFRMRGDCSYLAVPYLSSYRGIVLHQVRHPIAVVRSLVGTSFFRRGPDNKWMRPVVACFEPTGDEVRDAMRYYVEWNELCEPHAHLRFQIERIDEELEHILERIDPSRTLHARDALAQLPRDLNTRDRGDLNSFDELPAGRERDALAAIRDRYGYDDTPGAS